MYKGRYLHTITARDVRDPMNNELKFKLSPLALLETMGKLQPCDIGKQVYEMPGGHYQVENDEQLKARLNRE